MLPALKAGTPFRILVVDDDPVAADVLREVMKNLRRRYELHFVWNGLEALDFLHCRGPYLDAPRPNLILLDMNMPRLGGLDTLSAIKGDPDLCVIPVIMLSTSSSPDEVRKSYQAHANCYVQKPSDLGRTVKLAEAVEAFWMDFVLLPTPGKLQAIDSKRHNPKFDAPPGEIRLGPPIAITSMEARSRAMYINDLPAETATPSRQTGCREKNSLLDEFGVAVRELLELHQQQFLAIVEGDGECHRFDLLIHMANEKKQLGKYAYLRHVEEHGCSNFNAANQA